MRYIAPKDAAELDATETREWLDSLDYVLQSGGPAKVARLLRELTIHARQNGVKLPFSANTPYINTISADEQVLMPGSPDIERRIKSLVRCLSYLDEELAALTRVRVVVALGRIAFDAFLQVLKRRNVVIRPKPAFHHGGIHRLPSGQVLIGCFHPSRQNTNTGKLTARMMDVVFRRALRLLESG